MYANPLSAADNSVTTRVGSEKTTFTLPLSGLPDPDLAPMIIFCSYTKVGATTRRYDFKLWHVTPQIMVAASMLEDFINKARLENVIPALDYTQSDLMQYL
ncbi:hypothetical protein RZS08_03345, partial [Arthrospira platensis SPKY1]|nr:hypothetical protein [Arthrospira platensis SPKY1]